MVVLISFLFFFFYIYIYFIVVYGLLLVLSLPETWHYNIAPQFSYVHAFKQLKYIAIHCGTKQGIPSSQRSAVKRKIWVGIGKPVQPSRY